MAADLFRAANLRSGEALFEVQWLGLQTGQVECAHGVKMSAESRLSELRCDAVLVPGCWAGSIEDVLGQLREKLTLIQALAALDRSVSLWAYCTGVLLAAETGRLKEQPATATWWMAPWLEREHPSVSWQWNQSYVVNQFNITARGIHGILPILCDRIERSLSTEAWGELRSVLVLPNSYPGPAVFQAIEGLANGDPMLRRLREVVENLPASQLTIDHLASTLAHAPRTLARKIKDLTGQPMGSYVQLIKLYQAGEHLLHTEKSVGQICAALGFLDESSFRRSFKRVTGHTPAEYRNISRG